MLGDLMKRDDGSTDDVHPSQEMRESISQLQLTADQASFDKDKCSLAHDVARFVHFVKAGDKRKHQEHIIKVLHLRAMNSTGAALVNTWMKNHCNMVCVEPEKLDTVIDQATDVACWVGQELVAATSSVCRQCLCSSW